MRVETQGKIHLCVSCPRQRPPRGTGESEGRIASVCVRGRVLPELIHSDKQTQGAEKEETFEAAGRCGFISPSISHKLCDVTIGMLLLSNGDNKIIPAQSTFY